MLGGILVVVTILVMSGLGAIGTVVLLIRALESRKWPTVDGKVITSEVVPDPDPTGRGVAFAPCVEYRYEVDGHLFTNARISYHEVHSSFRRFSEKLTKKYPVDSRVAVYYDPSKPAQSVLEPGPTWLNYLLVLILVPLFSFGLITVGQSLVKYGSVIKP